MTLGFRVSVIDGDPSWIFEYA